MKLLNENIHDSIIRLHVHSVNTDTMYHYSNNHMQPMYQNEYPTCSYIDARSNQLCDTKHTEVYFTPSLPQPQPQETPKTLKLASATTKTIKKVKTKSNRPLNNGPIDTSNFTIEERLVAAVWIHERKNTRTSITQIKRNFRQRFGRAPPAKNTLLVWERKVFSTGNVCDAPRPGRPSNRSMLTDRVSVSLAQHPSLSIRARAAALAVPRSTLRALLAADYRRDTSKDKPKAKKLTTRRSRPPPPPPTAAAPPCPPPPHARYDAHTHYGSSQDTHAHGCCVTSVNNAG